MSEILVEHVNVMKDAKKVSPQWWTLPKEDLADSLVPLVETIQQRQSYRELANIRHAMLYANQEMRGMYPGMFANSAVTSMPQARVTLNVIRAAIDTVSSKIATKKPRPFFLTEGGSAKKQNQAKKLNKFMDGQFQAMDLYSHKRKSFVDAAVFGTGATKFYITKDANDDYTVKAERVHIHELIVDDSDGIYGQPSQMHQVRYMSRWELLSLFPDKKQEIMSAKGGMKGNEYSPENPHIIKVYESWRLPSGPKTGDGRRAIAIDGCTLFEEVYKRQRFPFSFDRWASRTTGFYGSGIAEELTGNQIELNKLLRSIQLAQHLSCVPRVYVEMGSEVNTAHLNNEIGGIAKYKGQPPIIAAGQGMAAEVYQHVQFLYEKAFEQVGVSMLSAASKKPAGLNAGVALREYQDIESERFQMCEMSYQESFLDCAEIVIELMQEIVEKGGNPKVLISDNGGAAEQIKWKDINLTRDQYIMRLFPTSIFPTEPAAKLQAITEYVQTGWLDKDLAQTLLDYPDLKAYTSLSTANVNLINKLIETMIDDGDYESPEPYMDLERAKSMTQLAYVRAKLDKVPEDRLELLRRFIDDCQALISQAMQPASPTSPIPGQEQMPTAKPAALPASELLPQIQQPTGAMNGPIA
jgi:hypothetical protein